MKSILLFFILFAAAISSEAFSQTPEAVVDAQLKAYNARDITAFLATYADSIEVCDFPATVSMKGKSGLEKVYGGMFKTLAALEAKITKRMTIGNKVIDHETATFTRKDASGKLTSNSVTVVVIYEISGGLISRVTFIR